MLAASIISAAATAVLAMLAYVQIQAGRRVATEASEAAKRQWQPRVSARLWNGDLRAYFPDVPALQDDPERSLVGYYLENQGTGPGFNISHGHSINGRSHPSEYRGDLTLASGMQVPPVFNVDVPTGVRPMVISFDRAEMFGAEEIFLWTRFENLVGEPFEVRTYIQPQLPEAFRRLNLLAEGGRTNWLARFGHADRPELP